MYYIGELELKIEKVSGGPEHDLGLIDNVG